MMKTTQESVTATLAHADELLVRAVAMVDETFRGSRDSSERIALARWQEQRQYHDTGLLWRAELFVTSTDRFAAQRALQRLESRGDLRVTTRRERGRSIKLSTGAYNRGRALAGLAPLYDADVQSLYEFLRDARSTGPYYGRSADWAAECRIANQRDWGWDGEADELWAIEILLAPLLFHGCVEPRASAGRRLYYRAVPGIVPDATEPPEPVSEHPAADAVYWDTRAQYRHRLRSLPLLDNAEIGPIDLPSGVCMNW